MKTFVDVLNAYSKSVQTQVMLNHGITVEYLGLTKFGQAIYILSTQNSLSFQQALETGTNQNITIGQI